MFRLSNPNRTNVWITKSIVSVLVLSGFLLTPIIPAQAATVSAPVISPNSGTIYSNNKITITATSGATILYTTNGTTPTATSSLYSGPIYLFTPGTYTVKAIAIKPGYTNSSVTQANITTINTDPQNRSFLSTYGISVNKSNCTSITQTSCTSLNGIQQSTLNELVAMEQQCDRWKVPVGPLAINGNYCKIVVTGGTEGTEGNPHSGSGTCSHIGGGKVDIRSTMIDSSTSSDKFITTSGLFTKKSTNRGDGAPLYTRNSSGAIYADERASTFGTAHWDITKPGC